MNLSECKETFAALMAGYHHRADYSDAETVNATISNLKGALKGWTDHDAQHGTPTQWAKIAADYLAVLEERINNPPKKASAPAPIVDARPSKWARIGDMERQNAAERAYLAGKRSA